jgi:pyruvate kinase
MNKPSKQKISWEKTKIVATLGPASSSKELLQKMFIAGVDVCRLNFSHSTYEEHEKLIQTIRQLNHELNTHVPILADLQGPKIRIGQVENDAVELKEENTILITTKECIGTAEKVYLSYNTFPKDVKAGETILIDDGKLGLKVLSTNDKDEVIARIEHGGILSSHKGVNLPDTAISLPCLTEKDKNDLQFILDHDIEWIGLSFVRSAQDIITLKKIISQHKSSFKPRIIAKIEKPEAIKEMNQIIEAADGIMVARGDLGVEIPLQNVPMIQKTLVKKCMSAGKPVIIATQMMESMITNFRPTRAEVNDVANSVMDGADAVMLSGETSVGRYPVAVIETVQKILQQVEKFEGIYYKHSFRQNENTDRNITDAVCFNACEMAQQVNAKAIVGLTHTGYTAFKISSHRPKAGIFIFTNDLQLLNTLNLIWGVRGFYYDKFINIEQTIDEIKQILIREGYLHNGDLVINTGGTPVCLKSMTNMIKLSKITD